VGVIGVVAWSAVAAVLCLGTGLVCLVLAVARVGDRPTQLTHAAMGVAMAGMFAPWGDPVPMWVGVGAFTLLGTWFTALGLRRGRATRTTRHLTISSAAMVLMYVMHGRPETSPGGGGHAAHAAADGGATSLVTLLLTLVLAGYFAWHTWTCVERSRSAKCDTPTSGSRSVVRTPAGVQHVAHATMSALMAAMFLGVI
jgi:Domain of unknown function (DUF5134)